MLSVDVCFANAVRVAYLETEVLVYSFVVNLNGKRVHAYSLIEEVKSTATDGTNRVVTEYVALRSFSLHLLSMGNLSHFKTLSPRK